MNVVFRSPGTMWLPRFLCRSLAIGVPLLLTPLFARATESSDAELTAVFSTVHNGYHREKLPDGSLKTVRCVLAEGTFDPGGINDPSLDRLKFARLAVFLTGPLAKQGYRPAQDLNAADELIVVHWGRTIGWDGGSGYGDAYGTLNQTFDTMKSAFPNPADSSPIAVGVPVIGARTAGPGGTPGAAGKLGNMLLMLELQEEARNRADARNARLLGYHSTLAKLPVFPGNLSSPDRGDLVDEVEDDRYYVILAAYDIQTVKHRQPKILWITRFSLQARGNDFDRSVDRMAQAAAAYFGRSSDKLRREQMREGRVVPGKLEVIDYEVPKK